MASEGRKFPFKIRRAEEPPPSPPRRPRPAPEPPAAVATPVAPPIPPPPEEVEIEVAASGAEAEPYAASGRFSSLQKALSFLGAVAGSGFSSEAVCRRSPDQQEWWTGPDGPPDRVIQMVWTAGGVPYIGRDTRWAPVPVDGPSGAAKTRGRDILDVSKWPQIELAELLAELPLRPARYEPSEEVEIIAPGVLSGWILRRVITLGLGTSLRVATGCRLGQTGNDSGWIVHSVRARRGKVPASLVEAVSRLPHTTVANGSEQGAGRLLVDVHLRAPLAYSLLAQMIPEQEAWLFGAADVGHWRLRMADQAVDGAALMDYPAVAAVPSLAPPASARLPRPVPVRLVPQPRGPSRVEAVLLDDQELEWLRPLLAGRPVGEHSFLIPGNSAHLLLSANGFPGAVPFGIPLVHLKPGGLYVELGLGFAPPLPEAARAKVFGLSPEGIVVAVQDRTYRFNLAHLVPAWTLWVGEAPLVAAGLSGRGETLLNRVSQALRLLEARSLQVQTAPSPPPLSGRPGEKSDLLERALRAKNAGNWSQAAELLEAAGERGEAGRLYEKAAENAPET